MTDRPPSRGAWWRIVEEYLASLHHDDEAEPLVQPDDPWADAAPDAPGLTDDQRAFLAGTEDQPGVPRLVDAGSGPDDQPSVPRLAHRGPKRPGDALDDGHDPA